MPSSIKVRALSRMAAAFALIGGLGIPMVYGQEGQENGDQPAASLTLEQTCQSLLNGAPDHCPCTIERAREAGVSDDAIGAAIEHPMTNFHPPTGMSRVTFNKVRRAQQICAIEARYAQITDGKKTVGDTPNPQPDGTYTARPVRPTPEAQDSEANQNDGPCS